MSSPPYTQLEDSDQAASPEMEAPVGIDFSTDQQFPVSQPPQIGKNRNPPMISFRSSASAPVVYSEYKAGHSKFLGIGQIVIGILCIVLNGTILAVHHSSPVRYVYISSEICIGISFIVTGSVGIPSGAFKTRGLVITFMVLCIISALGAAFILIVSAISLEFLDRDCYLEQKEWIIWGCPFNYKAGLSLYSLLMFLSVLEGIFSIWGIFICGIVISCCGEKSSTSSESIPLHYSQPPMVSPPLVDASSKNHKSSNQRINPNLNQEFLVGQSAQVANVNGSSQMLYSGSPASVLYNEPRAGPRLIVKQVGFIVESKFLGITQIIIGIMCIVMYVASGTVSRRILNDIQFPEVALSSGIFFIITGSFAFPAGALKQKRFLITFLVLSIISIVGASLLLIMNTVLIFMKATRPCYWGCRNLYEDSVRPAYVFYGLLIILAIFEEICSIWSTVICGKVIGCCRAKATNQTESISSPHSQTSMVAPLVAAAPQNQESPHQGIIPNIGQACQVSQPAQVDEKSSGAPQKLYYGKPASVVCNEYRSVQSKFLGITQIMIGISCIIIYVASLVVLYIYHGQVYYTDSPEFDLISGVLFIITGSLAFPAGASKQKRFIITFMIVSIISIVGASVLLILNAFAMLNLVVDKCYSECSPYDSISLSFYCLLVLLSIFEEICSIWGTVICGQVIGCCDAKTTIQNSIPPQKIMFWTTNVYPQAFITSDHNSEAGPMLNYGPPNQTPGPVWNVEKVNSNTYEKTNLNTE